MFETLPCANAKRKIGVNGTIPLRTFVVASVDAQFGRFKEVGWWDEKAQQIQDKADQRIVVFLFFLGEVRPA